MATPIDFVPYPPTSFPVRDLLVLAELPLAPDDDVCEIGIGSGGTCARLARVCKNVVGFEISSATVDALRYLEVRHPNLRFEVADLTQPDEVAHFSGRFSRLVSCDTLEHVSNPRGFFQAVGSLLKPGGRFLVTFPNEAAHRMHGVTRFDTSADLTTLLGEAGLEGRVGIANLSPYADRMAQMLACAPLRLARKYLRRRRRMPAGAGRAPHPQSFEDTDFMKRMGTWKKISPAINLYWYGVLKAMSGRGPAFVVDWTFTQPSFENAQVVVMGTKVGKVPGG